MDDFTVTLAGHAITDPLDRLRRYCGKPWSGGPPEVWAWQYYDQVPTSPTDTIDAIDVLAAGALHPGLTRSDLTFFVERGDDLTDWLAGLPAWDTDDPRPVVFPSAPDEILDHLGALVRWADEVSLPLLTKVLHRKRPRLIPLLGHHLIDAYRPLTGQRRATKAWRPLLDALRNDLNDETALLLAVGSGTLGLRSALSETPGPLRLADIVLWIGAHQ